MPDDTDKKDKQVGLRLPETLINSLARVAKKQNATPQDLLRDAAEALVECAKAHGRVPRDMKIVQAAHPSAAEAKAAYETYMTREGADTPFAETAVKLVDDVMETIARHPMYIDEKLWVTLLPYFRAELMSRLYPALSSPAAALAGPTILALHTQEQAGSSAKPRPPGRK